MKDIQFTKQGNTYVAEFEVNADFNLHIEKSRSGYLYMRQRSTSGKWDSVRNFQVAENDYIVDYDFTALVYPKQIRLVSEYAPTMCALTSEGDVIEIKSQSKEVEITQNGEMSVTPDDGFAYLSSVNVKTNVPQQGGGESGGSGGVSPDALILEPNGWYWKFDDINRDAKELSQILARLAILMNIKSGVLKNKAMNDSFVCDAYDVGYYTASMATDENRIIIAISEAKGARDMHLNLYDSFYDSVKTTDQPGLTESDFESMMNQSFGLTRITKEEFYNLES